jgi:hypothetical protein
MCPSALGEVRVKEKEEEEKMMRRREDDVSVKGSFFSAPRACSCSCLPVDCNDDNNNNNKKYHMTRCFSCFHCVHLSPPDAFRCAHARAMADAGL